MSEPKKVPGQHQDTQPGHQDEMHPKPETIKEGYRGSGKLQGKVALISGGDSGIGRAVALHFAKEGADVAILYLEEDDDARHTQKLVEEAGQRCLLLSGDIGVPDTSQKAVARTLEEFGRLDVLVNNAAEQHVVEDFTKISPEQLQRTFATNLFGMFYLTQAALPHLKKGAAIVCTTSITSYQGHKQLMDYASTKGGITTLIRSLSQRLAEQGIRVNGVAPGPIWTPLIPSSFSREDVAKFGQDTPMGRPGQPSEVAPAYVFLASDQASYITGQVIHVNGGEMVGG